MTTSSISTKWTQQSIKSWVQTHSEVAFFSSMSVNFKSNFSWLPILQKNQRNFSHFSALASKKSWKIVQTQDESTKILIWCYLTQWNSFIALIRPLLKARAKNVKNFVGFLGNEKTRLFAFEIYWPLARVQTINTYEDIFRLLCTSPIHIVMHRP